MEVIRAQVVVLGAGPGGYAAAFLAADKGLTTVLVDASPRMGGTCLQVGCIPSKSVLHVAKLINEAKEGSHFGVTFGPPKIDINGVRGHWQKVVEGLTRNLAVLRDARKIRYVNGRGSFLDANTMPPLFQIGSSRVRDSTGALALEDIPTKLLVVGGGYIGLEMGTVYAALGSKVTVVEMTDNLLPGADRDLVVPLQKRLQGQFSQILLKTKVTKLEEVGKTIRATLEAPDGTTSLDTFDRVLIAVGRRPNTRDIGLEKAGIEMDPKGFIPVDPQRRTVVKSIFAIGDVAGEPMLAHKATFEGKVAVEALCGEPVIYDVRAVPAVVFTDPEIAWCGLTEAEAEKGKIPFKRLRFPWTGSGRAMTRGRTDGLTKILIDPVTDRVLGIGLSGIDAGEMIGEAMLAMEMGATARDLALTMHAHPTLSETIMEAAEVSHGYPTHAMPAKR